MRGALLFALALLAAPTHAFELKPFFASYTADWKQMPISGSAERSLKKLDGTRWDYEFKASMLLASVTEQSTFSVENGRLVPLAYRYERSGMGKDKKVRHDFDWQAKTVQGSERDKPVKLPLNRGLLDKSLYQLELQKDVAEGKKSMSYQVLDGDEIETYDFRVLGNENVRTRVGLVEAVKVERVRDPTQTNRKTVFWLAKDWDYLMVRLHQVEKDGKEYQIMLKEGTVDGRPVKGRLD
ncbi:hypothetical protein AvCA_36910 [Azotobacter vinelandii CA]|uniref:Dehydrogenase n=3 Tax=Azotobacter group TaxID=351 RepID=C1DRW2_AZOVD|nr:DUF3108 domain-containing protein [Azotobacter vinelandii]ACO79837.1 conserved hypothetical protein [Azotobacter vinelandii DJ]AGK14552.1 hypothetical protein AvCA_36910 [Azotobacter vinelandii CA]AGK21541.1 hypothetical protein AvCA6_36910 [Azotobacter vinelandii CA6]WKN20622.1 DUF3108 domain-containing protein [Azotobacter vinelandii]SFX43480.1 Protein of unknown function [Azotobacter vinelandii]